ncbi:UNVERIFIED_CONTAM: hypothetical protein RMT77_002045 [Armadillidium vulgare]
MAVSLRNLLFVIFFIISTHTRAERLESNTKETEDSDDDVIPKRVVGKTSSFRGSRLRNSALVKQEESLIKPGIKPERADLSQAVVPHLCDARNCYRPSLFCSPLVFCSAYYEEIEKRALFCKIGTQGYGANCKAVSTTSSATLFSKSILPQLQTVTANRIDSKVHSRRAQLQHVDAVTDSQAETAFLAAKQEVQELERFEQTVSSKNIITNQNTPEFIHSQFFKTTPEAIEVSKIAIAQNFASNSLKESLKLTPQEAVQKLTKTDASGIGNCPKPPTCTSSDNLYRRYDGSCNNLRNPSWGKALTPYLRKTNFANYYDGLGIPRKSVSSGADLPSARRISSRIVKNLNKPSPTFTLSVMQWGQFVDHDVAHTPISAFFSPYGSGSNPIQCCDSNGLPLPASTSHSQCFHIEIPIDDLFYSRHNQRCMNFVRSLPAPSIDCKLGPRNQMNQISHYLDGSAVYGSSTSSARSLRLFRDGLLKEVNRLLPNDPKTIKFDFLAGDTRVNEQPHLSIVHTLWLRQHNKIANEL